MKDKRNMTEETEHLPVNERVKQQNKLWVIFFLSKLRGKNK